MKKLFVPYQNAIDVVPETGPQEVGLYVYHNDMEYPFWALSILTKKNKGDVIFKHIGVNNISKTTNQAEYQPRYVIATRRLDTWKHKAKYEAVHSSDDVRVFLKKG